MKMTYLGAGLTAALALVWTASCGGNVIVDAGAGGAGAGGPGSGAGPGSTTSTGTGVDPESACQQLCQTLDQFGCSSGPVQECVAGCVELFTQSPLCSPQGQVYLDCLLSELSGCEVPPACTGLQNDFEQCVSGSGCSGTIDCFEGSDGSCGCKGECQGSEVAVECSPQPEGLICSCFSNGAQVATCQDFSGTCDIQSGCCAPFLFGFKD